MSKNKQQKFAEVAGFPNVLQPAYKSIIEDNEIKGNWNKDFFKNDNPIVLELACGKGEYTVGLAERNPNINYVGVDVKGARIYTGSKYALENDLKNAGFLRIQIEQINHFFAENEVSGLWIIFPDPQPQKPRTKKRLTSPNFLKRYSKMLKPGSIIHLKTDNDQLFQYTLDVIEEEKHELITYTRDLYNSDLVDEILAIHTFYEKMFLKEGSNINYLQFRLNHAVYA